MANQIFTLITFLPITSILDVNYLEYFIIRTKRNEKLQFKFEFSADFLVNLRHGKISSAHIRVW